MERKIMNNWEINNSKNMIGDPEISEMEFYYTMSEEEKKSGADDTLEETPEDSTKEIRLFDLENDPLENNNIAQNNPSVVKEMEEVLEELTKNVTIENMDDKRLKRIQEELRLLGYRKT